MSNPDYGVRPPAPEFISQQGYRPNIDCMHFFEGRCAHPSARRAILPNKHCVMSDPKDRRCNGCRFQVKSERPTPPRNPPAAPGSE